MGQIGEHFRFHEGVIQDLPGTQNSYNYLFPIPLTIENRHLFYQGEGGPILDPELFLPSAYLKPSPAKFITVTTKEVQKEESQKEPKGLFSGLLALTGLGLALKKNNHTLLGRRSFIKGAFALFVAIKSSSIEASGKAIHLPYTGNNGDVPTPIMVTTVPSDTPTAPSTNTPKPTTPPTIVPTEMATTQPTEPPSTLTPTPEATQPPVDDLEKKLKEYPEVQDGVGPTEVDNTSGFWYETTPGGTPEIPDEIRKFLVHGHHQASYTSEDIQRRTPWNLPIETVDFATEHGHVGITQFASIHPDTKKVVFTYYVSQAPKMFEASEEGNYSVLMQQVEADGYEFVVEVDRDTGHTILVLHFKQVEEDNPDRKGEKRRVNKTFTIHYDVYNKMSEYQPGNRAVTISRGIGGWARSKFEANFRYKKEDREKLPLRDIDPLTLEHARGGMITLVEAVMEQLPSRTDPSAPWGIMRFFNRQDYTRGVSRGALGIDIRMFTDPSNQCGYSSTRQALDNTQAWGWKEPNLRQLKSIFAFEKLRNLPRDITSIILGGTGLRKKTPEAFNLATAKGQAEARQRMKDEIHTYASIMQDPANGINRPIFVVVDGWCDSKDWKLAWEDQKLPHSYFVEAMKEAQRAGVRHLAFREEHQFGSGQSRQDILKHREHIKSRLQECAEQYDPITNLTFVAPGTISAKNIRGSLDGVDDSVSDLLQWINQINLELKADTARLQNTDSSIVPIERVILDIFIDHGGMPEGSQKTTIDEVRRALFELRKKDPDSIPFDIKIRMAEDTALLVPEKRPSLFSRASQRVFPFLFKNEKIAA